MTAPRDPSSVKSEPEEVTVPKRQGSSVIVALTVIAIAIGGIVTYLVMASGDGSPDTTTDATIAAPTTTGAPATTSAATTTPPTIAATTTVADAATTTPATIDLGPLPEHVPVLTGTANFSMDLDLDPEGLAVFAVLAPEQRGVIVGRCLDTSCATVETNEVAFPSGGEMYDLTLGPEGNPILDVRHWPVGDEGLNLSGIVRCADPLCTESVFASFGETWAQRTTTTDDGSPVWVSEGAENLEIARCTDPLCTEPERAVIPKEPSEQLTPLAFTLANGGPLIAAVSVDLQALRFFECSNPACSSWTEHTVDLPEQLADFAGYSAAGVYGQDGRLAILASEGRMRVVTCADPICEEGTTGAYLGVATDAGPEGGREIAIRDGGSPVLVYTTSDPSMDAWRIEVASCDDPTCASGTISVIEPDHGAAGASIVLDGDLPVIGTLYQTENTASIYRCADPTCEHGAASVTRWDENTVIGREAVGPPASGWKALERYQRGNAGGLVELGEELIVVGTRCSNDAMACTPVVGRSADGETWRWQDADLGEQGWARFADAAVIGDRVVVAGERCPGGPMEECWPYLWTTDLETWTPVEVEGCEGGCSGYLTDLVETPLGMLLSGDVNGYSTLWISSDGSTWKQADVEGYPDWLTWMSSAAPIGNGLIGVGQTCPEEMDYECMPLLWRSTDGSEWTQADATGLEFSQVDGMAVWDGGVTVFGGYCPEDAMFCHPAAWTSSDSIGWTRHDFEGVAPGMVRATAFDTGVVAVISGYDRYWSEEVTTLALTRDGVDWELFEPDEAGRVSANFVLVDGDRLLLAGEGDPQITIWEWRP